MSIEQKIAEILAESKAKQQVDEAKYEPAAPDPEAIAKRKAREAAQARIEAKRQEKLNIWSAIKQAETNCRDGITPLVVFKRNHSESYVIVPGDHFFKLISKFTEKDSIL